MDTGSSNPERYRGLTRITIKRLFLIKCEAYQRIGTMETRRCEVKKLSGDDTNSGEER